jgi:O-methyltransferase
MGITLKIKKPLKGIVKLVGAILSQKHFDAFYGLLFPKYKSIVRSLYYFKGLLGYFRTRNEETWDMAKNIHRVMPYTLVGIGGLEVSYKLAKLMNSNKIGGDFIELGVARGGCAALLASVAFEEFVAVKRTLWLFDSFEGLPEPTKDDFDTNQGKGTGNHIRPLPQGSCLGTLEEVQNLLFYNFSFSQEKIEFVKGWFNKTVPERKQDIGDIAILRIDGDWYESTKTCLEELYDKVVQGGAVIIDDYQSCYGCEKAVTEFVQKRGLNIDIKLDGRGGCYFLKPNLGD